MKTVLYPTDCSATSADVLKEWLSCSSEAPSQVTVVYAYDIPTNAPLNKTTFHSAKAEAATKAREWVAEATNGWQGTVNVRTILGAPERIVASCLVLYRHDLLLVDDREFGLSDNVAETLRQTSTEVAYAGEMALA